ncbi:MAG: GTPase ObgE [Candidatus Omnitrophota bacterium]
MLIDQAKIYVFGGKGGDGCQSLYKDLFNRKGIPDGGDGGAGGDVIAISESNLHTLLDFKYNQHYKGGKGTHGGSNKKFGKRGDDFLFKVPVGTVIKDAETGMVIRDLNVNGEQVIVVKGGSGGKGSAKLRAATMGRDGEKRTLLLELKLVADAGLIGFPNVGKSTLISRISKSHSKIAAYPFTTKSPRLGVVQVYDGSFVAADMPGLIEGAHSGKGLGDRFLRHIERTMVLVHVVDIVPMDGADPVDNFFKLEKELKLYSSEVFKKPRIIVANKMDMPVAELNLKKFIKAIGKNKKVVPISALTGKGLDELVKILYRKITNVKKKNQEDNSKSRIPGTY